MRNRESGWIWVPIFCTLFIKLLRNFSGSWASDSWKEKVSGLKPGWLTNRTQEQTLTLGDWSKRWDGCAWRLEAWGEQWRGWLWTQLRRGRWILEPVSWKWILRECPWLPAKPADQVCTEGAIPQAAVAFRHPKQGIMSPNLFSFLKVVLNRWNLQVPLLFRKQRRLIPQWGLKGWESSGRRSERVVHMFIPTQLPALEWRVVGGNAAESSLELPIEPFHLSIGLGNAALTPSARAAGRAYSLVSDSREGH